MKLNKLTLSAMILATTVPLVSMDSQTTPPAQSSQEVVTQTTPTNAERLKNIVSGITKLYAPFKLNCGYSTEEKILIEKIGLMIDSILEEAQTYSEQEDDEQTKAMSNATLGLLEHFVFLQKEHDAMLELKTLECISQGDMPNYCEKQRARVFVAHQLCKKMNEYWVKLTSSQPEKLELIKSQFCVNSDFYKTQEAVFDSYANIVESFNKFKFSIDDTLNESFIEKVAQTIKLIEFKKQEIIDTISKNTTHKKAKEFTHSLDVQNKQFAFLEALENHLILIKMEAWLFINKSEQYSENKTMLKIYFQYKTLSQDATFVSLSTSSSLEKALGNFKRIMETYISTNSLQQGIIQDLHETLAILKFALQKYENAGPVAKILRLFGQSNEKQTVLVTAISMLENVWKTFDTEGDSQAKPGLVGQVLKEAMNWSPVARGFLEKTIAKPAAVAKPRLTQAEEVA